MPCSCGNASCPCGIPCYCLEESCKCLSCAIALHRVCKICDKPLINDIQTEDTCSCFVGESTALILNEDNPQCQMGNIPMPVGCFVYGKLIVNVMIPVQRLPQFLPQQPISSMPPPLSIHTDSRKIMPSFISGIDVATPLSSGNSANLSPAESYQLLKKSRGEASYYTPLDICSNDAPNIDASFKKTCHPFVLQSPGETENLVQNTKSETEESAIGHKPSTFYLPSIRIGNISYPVELADPVWKLPNRAFCLAGNSDPNLKLCNPFYMTGPIQKNNTSVQKCHQQSLNLNFNSNGLAQHNNVTNLQINEQPLDSIRMDRPDLEIYGKSAEFEAPLAFSAGNEFSAFPLSGNSKATALMEPSNEVSVNYSMHDQKITAAAIEISSSGMQNLSYVQSQSVSATLESGKNYFQNDTVDYNFAKTILTGDNLQYNNLSNFSPFATQFLPEYFEAPNITSKLQPLFNMHSTQSSEENEYPQNSNSSSDLLNNKRKTEKDSVPLYIDTSTTQKMEKLLKSSKRLSINSTFAKVVSPTQNSDSNKLSDYIYNVE